MKQSTRNHHWPMSAEGNHELWHVCTNCGWQYDRRLHGNTCPRCQTVCKTHTAGILAFTFLFFWIVIILFLGMCSCITQEHGLRRHRNKVAQEIIQNTKSLSAGQDWTRVYRNWDYRPKSHWPFRD